MRFTSAMLFGRDADETVLATRVGRTGWPDATNGYRSIESTGFVEIYHDYQGNRFQELNNPRRYFSSYRLGTQHR
jgi:hypothetical protein